ncbi:MAG TPA: hypothetical protein VD997_04180 [Phycisphaerales bacterium]|nr:hypothetical protein [Phycisphaerales bacterium]
MFVAAAPARGAFVGHVYMNDNYRGPTTMGGEFRVETVNFHFTPAATGTMFKWGLAPAPGLFESFCLEKFEDQVYHTLLSADLSTSTTAGSAAYAGVGGGALGGAADALDPRTAYLYSHFIHQTLLTPYDYAVEANRHLDADELQKAIWFIEEEDATALTGKALLFFNEAQAAVSSGAWTGLGDVRVLNLYTFENGARVDWQDQLVVIPAPAGAAVIGAGLLSLTRRRRR